MLELKGVVQFMSFKKGVPLGVPVPETPLSPSSATAAAASLMGSPTAAAAAAGATQGTKMVEKQLKKMPSSAQLLGKKSQFGLRKAKKLT